MISLLSSSLRLTGTFTKIKIKLLIHRGPHKDTMTDSYGAAFELSLDLLGRRVSLCRVRLRSCFLFAAQIFCVLSFFSQLGGIEQSVTEATVKKHSTKHTYEAK